MTAREPERFDSVSVPADQTPAARLATSCSPLR